MPEEQVIEPAAPAEPAAPDTGSKPTPTFDDFISRKSGVEPKPTPEPKPAVPKIEEQKEPEPKEKETPEPEPKEGEIKLPDFQPFNEQPTPAEKPAPTKRELANKDFTGIAEADLPRFTELARRMSIEGFAELRKQYLANQEKEAKIAQYEASKPKPGEIPPSYYAHPEGYKLSQEYNNLDYVTGIADKLVEHWQEQYEKVQLGEPWINVQVNKENGELEYSAPQVVAPEQKARLAAQMLRQVTQATMQANQLNQQKQQFIGSYQAKVGEAGASIQQIKNTFFKGWEDPKHPSAPLQKKYLEQVHPAHRDNPYAQLFVMGKVLFDAAQARIKELETQLKGKQTNSQIPAQPKKDETIVPSTSGVKTPTFDDFVKRKMAA